MYPVDPVHRTRGDAAGIHKSMTLHVHQHPRVGTNRPMEPDVVIETGHHHLLPVQPARMGKHDRVHRVVIGEIRQRACMQERVVAKFASFRRDASPELRPSSGRRLGDLADITEGSPLEPGDRVGHRNIDGDGRLLDVDVGFAPLEARVEVQDRTGRLTGDDATGGERPSFPEPIHVEGDRLLRDTTEHKVCVQRMSRMLLGHRGCSSGQRLGNNLAAVDATPRVGGRQTEERQIVEPVEGEEISKGVQRSSVSHGRANLRQVRWCDSSREFMPQRHGHVPA